MNTTKEDPRIGTRRASYRYAGHCYATTYTYPCIEEFTMRKKGTGGFWRKVSQWGRRAFRAGYKHRDTMRILRDWAPEIATHNEEVERVAKSAGL